MPRTLFDEAGRVLNDLRHRRDGVTIPKIWVTLALSALIHTVVLWQWLPQIRRPSSDLLERDKTGPLIVQLAPRPRAPQAPPPSRASEARRAPAPRPQKSPATPRSQPPALALKKPRASPSPPLRSPSFPSSPRAPGEGDLASYVESKRRARGETPTATAAVESPPSASAEDDNARANRIAAANLGLDRAPTFGSQRRRGGGVFDIRHMGYDYAEFAFFGWSKEIRRNTSQLIEVRKGTNPDIRIAVVRRMIAIIREHEQGDFTWESHRLGRSITLSARPRDTAGLEEFLMREFF